MAFFDSNGLNVFAVPPISLRDYGEDEDSLPPLFPDSLLSGNSSSNSDFSVIENIKDDADQRVSDAFFDSMRINQEDYSIEDLTLHSATDPFAFAENVPGLEPNPQTLAMGVAAVVNPCFSLNPISFVAREKPTEDCNQTRPRKRRVYQAKYYKTNWDLIRECKTKYRETLLAQKKALLQDAIEGPTLHSVSGHFAFAENDHGLETNLQILAMAIAAVVNPCFSLNPSSFVAREKSTEDCNQTRPKKRRAYQAKYYKTNREQIRERKAKHRKKLQEQKALLKEAVENASN